MGADDFPRRLPFCHLAGGVVRVVVPSASASDLTPAERAFAKEHNIDPTEMARGFEFHRLQRANRANFGLRLPGESDASLVLRRRHHDALEFARWLVIELEALRPIAEAGPVEDPDERLARETRSLSAALLIAEAGRAHREHGEPGSVVPRRIGVVRDTLNRGRHWLTSRWVRLSPILEAGEEMPEPPYPEIPEAEQAELRASDIDLIIEEAIRDAPELARVSPDEWRAAIDRWPGLPSGRGGARPRKGGKTVTWYRVVFDLLAPHDLAGRGASPESLKKTFEGAPKKRARPSRAK